MGLSYFLFVVTFSKVLTAALDKKGDEYRQYPWDFIDYINYEKDGKSTVLKDYAQNEVLRRAIAEARQWIQNFRKDGPTSDVVIEKLTTSVPIEDSGEVTITSNSVFDLTENDVKTRESIVATTGIIAHELAKRNDITTVADGPILGRYDVNSEFADVVTDVGVAGLVKPTLAFDVNIEAPGLTGKSVTSTPVQPTSAITTTTKSHRNGLKEGMTSPLVENKDVQNNIFTKKRKNSTNSRGNSKINNTKLSAYNSGSRANLNKPTQAGSEIIDNQIYPNFVVDDYYVQKLNDFNRVKSGALSSERDDFLKLQRAVADESKSPDRSAFWMLTIVTTGLILSVVLITMVAVCVRRRRSNQRRHGNAVETAAEFKTDVFTPWETTYWRGSRIDVMETIPNYTLEDKLITLHGKMDDNASLSPASSICSIPDLAFDHYSPPFQNETIEDFHSSVRALGEFSSQMDPPSVTTNSIAKKTHDRVTLNNVKEKHSVSSFISKSTANVSIKSSNV